MKNFKFLKGNNLFLALLLGSILLLLIFISVAIFSGAWPGSDVSGQILSALSGAVVAAMITMLLLLGQTANEEEKDRNAKIFEEKLRIYQDFLHCLCDVIKDGEVTKEEAIQLEFQTSYITMHAKSENIKEIAKSLKEIINSLNDGSANTAEEASQRNNLLMEKLFVIVGEFQKDLYQLSPSAEDVKNRMDASQSFCDIMEAVEVQTKEVDEQVLNSSTASTLPQNIEEFTEELLQKIKLNEAFWTLSKKDLTENNIYLNFAMKGREEDVRVMLNYETNGEHYFQIHMKCDDTHETYKQMKWRFGGRQNQWSWWRYLDSSYRSLTSTEAITSHSWDELLSVLTKQISSLLKYVETYQKVTNEIYDNAPKDKAAVWMYYETCVAFDYKKTLGDDDQFFMDVVLQDDDTYNILFGNRDNDHKKLLSRLHALDFKDVADSQIEEDRFTPYKGLNAAEASQKIAQIDSQITK